MNRRFPTGTLWMPILLLALAPPIFSEDDVQDGESLGEKWKRTKSLTAPAPVEKIRKGLALEIGESSEAAEPDSRPVRASEVAVKVDADSGVVFSNIRFRRDSAELVGGKTFAQLVEIGKGMEEAGDETFLIEGHTCDLDSEDYNLRLSYLRALAVREALVEIGVEKGRLQVLAFGEMDPAVPNVDEASRSQNRRVEIYRKL